MGEYDRPLATDPPWEHLSGQLVTDIIHDRGPLAETVASDVPYELAERIVACVNAMSGIEDPAAFMGAVQKVVEGFDLGVFVRGTKDDADPEWAIKLMPYLVALGKLVPAKDGGDDRDE